MQRKTAEMRATALLCLLAVLACPGCGWLCVAVHAAGYRVTDTGEAGNVVVHGEVAYVTRAGLGLEIFDLEHGRQLAIIPPPRGSESIDDVAVADGLLFLLDAGPPGHLSVYAADNRAAPALRAGPLEVPVGPFSGVSAAAGHVVVSGGTSALTLRTYAADGSLGADVATGDFGRGQPDVLLAPDGHRAFVSTHFRGPHFGLTTAQITSAPLSIVKRSTIDLETIGFTAGGAKPANFPIETALAGDVLLVAYARGLALVGVSALDHPTILSEVRLAVQPVNVDVRDGVAAVVGSSPTPALVLLDIDNPAAPKVIRTVPLPEDADATGVAIGATRVVVAAGARGVLLFSRGSETSVAD